MLHWCGGHGVVEYQLKGARCDYITTCCVATKITDPGLNCGAADVDCTPSTSLQTGMGRCVSILRFSSYLESRFTPHCNKNYIRRPSLHSQHTLSPTCLLSSVRGKMHKQHIKEYTEINNCCALYGVLFFTNKTQI